MTKACDASHILYVSKHGHDPLACTDIVVTSRVGPPHKLLCLSALALRFPGSLAGLMLLARPAACPGLSGIKFLIRHELPKSKSVSTLRLKASTTRVTDTRIAVLKRMDAAGIEGIERMGRGILMQPSSSVYFLYHSEHGHPNEKGSISGRLTRQDQFVDIAVPLACHFVY